MNIEQSIVRGDGSKINLLVNKVVNAKAQVIFAHGAGANMCHEFMHDMTTFFNELGINVIRFNFPFMDKRLITDKKYPPDRMPKLLACYEEVISYVVDQTSNKGIPLFIGGKSMGSRVAATLVADIDPKFLSKELKAQIQGVFCIGYPFHPAKKPEKLRLEPLMLSDKAALIIQGQRDTLGNQEEVISYSLPTHCQCIFLNDGDHSLKPRVKSGFTQQEHMLSAAQHIMNFIEENTPCSP